MEGVVIVNSIAYANGRRVAEPTLEEIGPLLRERPDHFVWVGLREPSEDLLAEVRRQFDLHELAIEDAHRAHQRPKLEEYDDALFVVLRTTALDGENGRMAVGETHIFVGRSYVVSVRHGPSLPYADLRSRCEGRPDLLSLGPGYVLYALMDFVVDHYEPMADALEDGVEEVEDAVVDEAFDGLIMSRLHDLRRDLLMLRRAAVPIPEICSRLMHLPPARMPPELHPYFRDISDHAMRVVERTEGSREALTHTLETHLSLNAVRQNEDMRKLAGWAAIFAVPTVIASIFGMNFDTLPGIHTAFGPWVTFAGMAVAAGGLYALFRRSGWL